MALRPDRDIQHWDINFVNNDVCAEGAILCYSTAGSGDGVLDTKRGLVQLAADPSGLTPKGLTVSEFVNIDQTQQHRNWHKVQQVVGEKAPLATHGWVTTNLYYGSPTAGNTAYLTSSGWVQPTAHASGGTSATPVVGRFENAPDEDGYVRLYIQIP